MKLRAIAISLTIMFAFGMATSFGTAHNVAHANEVTAQKPPRPKLVRTISLGRAPLLGVLTGRFAPIVEKLSFSPDGRYLGIVELTSDSGTDIVIWDVDRNKEQVHIRCDDDYAESSPDRLLWLQGGKVVTFGVQSQWDSMSGKALPNNPAIGRYARLNKDGTKMLTIDGAIGEPTTIHVYDTRTWAGQKIDVDALDVSLATWTADDKIMVTASVTAEAHGKTLDGHRVDWDDTAVRLLDPSGKMQTKGVWFNAIKTGNPQWPTEVAFPVEGVMKTSFATNKIFFDSAQMIDGKTLVISPYRSFNKDDISPGGFGMAPSPDGRWLYLKGITFPDHTRKSTENSIVDTTTGLPVLQFTGGNNDMGDIAASPDGKWLAVGDGHSIFLFSLK